MPLHSCYIKHKNKTTFKLYKVKNKTPKLWSRKKTRFYSVRIKTDIDIILQGWGWKNVLSKPRVSRGSRIPIQSSMYAHLVCSCLQPIFRCWQGKQLVESFSSTNKLRKSIFVRVLIQHMRKPTQNIVLLKVIEII